MSSVLREDCSRFNRKLIEVQHLLVDAAFYYRLPPSLPTMGREGVLFVISYQIPQIYFNFLFSGGLLSSPLLSPSLGKFQLKCLTNLPCQGCCSRYTQRISINLHESWPLLDWFMSRWVLQSKHNTVRLSGFKLGLLDIDCQFTVYLNFETSRNSKA